MAELAGRQHGVVARRQLLELGLGRRGIDERLARGRLHLVHNGVYAVGHRALTTDGLWLAAVLACGPGAVASHRCAGQLWGLLPRTAILPEVTRPRKFRGRPGILGHHALLPPDEIGAVRGIPVTSAPRTMLDLAAVLKRRQLERALNEMEVRQLLDPLSIPDLLARHPRRRGAAALREVLADDGPGGVSRSDLEEGFVELLDAHGLPRPRMNATLPIRERLIEVDCLWRAQRLVVELDGGAMHRTKRAFESDRQRDRMLLTEGWRSARVTWRQLRDEAPAVASDLGRLLGAYP